jgi:hypothetical protein
MKFLMPNSLLLLTEVGSAIAIAKSGNRSVSWMLEKLFLGNGVVDRVLHHT